MSIVIVRPIVSPAIFANGPRSSTAVPITTHIRKNVVRRLDQGRLAEREAGSDRRDATGDLVERRAREVVLQQVGGGDRARHLGDDVDAACGRSAIFPFDHREICRAGLNTPPESWAIIETMIPIARPWASAIATRSCPCVAMIVPGAEEDERERADELGDGCLPGVLQRTLLASDGARRLMPGRSARA